MKKVQVFFGSELFSSLVYKEHKTLNGRIFFYIKDDEVVGSFPYNENYSFVFKNII